MQSMVEQVSGSPVLDIAAGEVFIRDGEKSDKIFVLIEGTIEVFREDVEIAVASRPGAVFGEMSLLLDVPHTASVRALEPSRLHVIENATAYLRDHPTLSLPIAQLLARRLQNATTYLVDLKHQFQHHDDHFGMVDEVLESLIHSQAGASSPSSSDERGQ